MSESPNDTALVPIDERTVGFHGDELVVVLVEGEQESTVFVPLRPICDNLGVSWAGQRERIMRDEVLAEVAQGVRVTRTPAKGGTQEMLCLPLDYLAGWLFGITASRVKPELRERITLYRRDCYRHLANAFRAPPSDTDLAVSPDTDLAPPRDDTAVLQQLQQLQQIAEMGRAITAMAEQQMELQRQQQALSARLDRAGQVVRGIQQRVGSIEVRLGEVEEKLHPGAFVTEEQANEVSLKVKALAEFLTTKDGTKNHYQGIFQELYRRFGVASYKIIRQGQFEAVMRFLDDWRTAAAAGRALPEA
jgi:hypothetical protein